ncbi:PREDICTED: uncharacterized protein LOC109149214 [Ipomoea nil]|uniref:uncharacterized protein LOC109149214 n=1 Tax=Ipomoea nil TaxID=35883 RepID=UPI0009010372|nr:PREDICTED: uncharacterized protein LOC109149214 [Ipomoea nil]
MDFEVFDTVKLEKAKAIARFNRFRRMTTSLQFLEVIVALMLVSWSCTRVPGVMKFSGEFLVELWVYVCNPHVVFVIGNAIIVALVVLCRQTDAGCSSVVSDFCGEDDGEEIGGGETQPPVVSSEASTPPPQPEAAGDETKQIVCSESVVQKPQCTELSTAMKTATKQIEKFQRTQSEKLKRAIALKPQGVLRRSETEMHRKAAGSGEPRAMPTIDTVEDLSSEEFRLRIEKFIRKNQEFFKVESG